MKLRSIALFAFCASALAAQEEARTFTFAHTQDPRHMQEMVNMIRSTAEVRDVALDPAQRAVSISGATRDQMALIAWMFTELDRPASRPQTLQVRDNTYNDPRASAVKI